MLWGSVLTLHPTPNPQPHPTLEVWPFVLLQSVEAPSAYYPLSSPIKSLVSLVTRPSAKSGLPLKCDIVQRLGSGSWIMSIDTNSPPCHSHSGHLSRPGTCRSRYPMSPFPQSSFPPPSLPFLPLQIFLSECVSLDCPSFRLGGSRGLVLSRVRTCMCDRERETGGERTHILRF